MNQKPDGEGNTIVKTLDPNRSLPTVDEVKEALRRAVPGANELNRQLDEVFTLPEASAMLRLH